MSSIEESKTFCVHFFTQAATETLGYWRPCCQFQGYGRTENGEKHHAENMTPQEFFNSSYMDRLREQSLAGVEISGCRQCYNLEKNQVQSMRQRHNRERGELVKDLVEEDYQPRLRALDLRLGNECNLGCLMCAPGASSVLDKEWKANGRELFSDYLLTTGELAEPFDFNNWYRDENLIARLIEVSRDLDYLWLVGGEPLINQGNLRLLEGLKHRGKDLKLEVSSNLTFFTPKVCNLLLEFDTVLKCSIDGIGETYNYIRYPGRFSKVEANFREVLKSGLRNDIVYSVSNLNLFHIPEFYHWFYKTCNDMQAASSISFSNIVENPVQFNPGLLPSGLKARADEMLASLIEKESTKKAPRYGTVYGLAELRGFLASQEESPQEIASKWKFVENMDRVRGNDWRAVSPWMAELK